MYTALTAIPYVLFVFTFLQPPQIYFPRCCHQQESVSPLQIGQPDRVFPWLKVFHWPPRSPQGDWPVGCPLSSLFCVSCKFAPAGMYSRLFLRVCGSLFSRHSCLAAPSVPVTRLPLANSCWPLPEIYAQYDPSRVHPSVVSLGSLGSVPVRFLPQLDHSHLAFFISVPGTQSGLSNG